MIELEPINNNKFGSRLSGESSNQFVGYYDILLNFRNKLVEKKSDLLAITAIEKKIKGIITEAIGELDEILDKMEEKGNDSVFEFQSGTRIIAPHLASLKKGKIRRFSYKLYLGFMYKRMDSNRSLTPFEAKDSPSHKIRKIITKLANIPEVKELSEEVARQLKRLQYRANFDEFYRLKNQVTKKFTAYISCGSCDIHGDLIDDNSKVKIKELQKELDQFDIDNLESVWGCINAYKTIYKLEKLVRSLNKNNLPPGDLQEFYDFINVAKPIVDYKYRKSTDSFKTQPNKFAKFVYILESSAPWLALLFFGLSFVCPPLIIVSIIFAFIPVITQSAKVIYQWCKCGRAPSIVEFVSSIGILLMAPFTVVVPVVKAIRINIVREVRSLLSVIQNACSYVGGALKRLWKDRSDNKTHYQSFEKIMQQRSMPGSNRLVKILCTLTNDKKLKLELIKKLKDLQKIYKKDRNKYQEILRDCTVVYKEAKAGGAEKNVAIRGVISLIINRINGDGVKSNSNQGRSTTNESETYSKVITSCCDERTILDSTNANEAGEKTSDKKEIEQTIKEESQKQEPEPYNKGKSELPPFTELTNQVKAAG